MIFTALTPRAAKGSWITRCRSRLAVAAAIVECITFAAQVGAQAAAESNPQTIVVTGTREPQPIDRLAGDVVVIDAQAIQSSGADSLEDLLRREAGVQVSRNGGAGQSAGVFIRGASASSTLVLVDGVRIGSATLGQTAFESIALAQIERVEILRGPGSSLYGADAVGGVVQIFTRRGEGEPKLSGRLAVGNYGGREGDIGVVGASSGFDYALTLSHEASTGVSALRPGDVFGNYNPDDDGFHRSTGQARVGFSPADGHRIGLSVMQSRIDARYDASEFAPPDFAQDASPDFHNRLNTQVAALDYRGTLSPQWTTTAQLSHNEDDTKAGGRLIDRFITRRDQLTWQNAYTPAAGQQVVLALERLEERAQSSSYAADVKRDNTALVIGYAGTFGAQGLQADLRHDDNSGFGAITTGRLGASIEIVPGLRARALAGTTFRAPSFNDLYFPGYGVSGIRPEQGRSFEVGLSWATGLSSASATVYRNEVRDLIGYESDPALCPPDPSYAFGCASNVTRARLQGATFSAAHRLDDLSLRASVDLLDAKDAATGERLARRAAHQENVDVDYDIGDWRFGASLLAVGSRPDGGKMLAAYETLDLRSRWRFAPGWQFEAKVLNVADRDIEPARDYQQPGRQAWIGVRYGAL